MQTVNSLREIWIKNFTDYVDTLSVNPFFKGMITDEQFIAKALPAYLFYPLLFNDCFGYHDEPTLRKLCLAGFFYYRALIELDEVVDSTALPVAKQYAPLISSICQEEAIKLLSSVFPLSSAFWSYWGHRREEYLKAVALDKANPAAMELTEYEDHADCKSAFGKIAIDSLHLLTGERHTTVYQDLLHAHRQFSIGFQLLDDVKDYRKDAVDAQVNWAHMQLNAHAQLHHYDIKAWPLSKQYKYLYLSGVAVTLLQQSNNYFSQSCATAQRLHLKIWQQTIRKQNKAIAYLRLYFEAHAKSAIAKANFSTELQPAASTTQPPSKAWLHTCLTLAEGFLGSSQNADGSWQDFHTNAGLSNCWATGYVLATIAEVPFAKGALKVKAARFLRNSHQPGAGWGYNTDWIADTDSTTTALLALDLCRQPMYAQYCAWIENQQADGGFGTYTDYDELHASLDGTKADLKGWLQNHTCVSSLAYYLLARTNDYPQTRERVRNYLLQAQTTEGLWESYWWTSPIYSTTYVVKGLLHEDYQRHQAPIDDAVTALLSKQLPDGSFAPETAEPTGPSAYYTALVLDTLCSNAALFARHAQAAERACHWLTTNQYRDGSWNSSRLMRIPAPHIQAPQADVYSWRFSSEGTNIIVEDVMRIFTTAVSMRAIHSYSKYL